MWCADAAANTPFSLAQHAQGMHARRPKPQHTHIDTQHTRMPHRSTAQQAVTVATAAFIQSKGQYQGDPLASK
jgi:hypothetical protein